MINHAQLFKPVVYYNNERSSTVILRDSLEEEPKCHGAATYASREAMLEAEMANRGQSGEIKSICGSDIPRAGFYASIDPKGLLGVNKILDLGNQYFSHSSLNGMTFIGSDGKVHQVYNAITPSLDESSLDLMMARVLQDEHGSICYGGRPDSNRKARQQAEDIFRTERAYGKHSKTLVRRGDVYELTYVVDSLTSAGVIQPPGMPNERKEILDEHQALKDLKDGDIIEVDGCRVRLHPIHVHHMLTIWSRIAPLIPEETSGIALEKEINAAGYQELKSAAQARCHFANRSIEKQLVDDTIFHLDNPDLAVHERLILVDFLAKMSGLPIVHHCHSIIDRTSIATGIAAINQLIVHGDIPKDRIPKDSNGKYAVHLLCRDEEYKHLFLAMLNLQHQVSKDAWIGVHPNGTIAGRSKLGLNYFVPFIGTTVGSALDLLPSSTLKLVSWETYALRVTYAVVFLTLVITLVYHIAVLILSLCTQDWEFGKHLAILPFQIKWLKLGEIDASTTLDLESLEINGGERALILGASTTHTLTRDIFPPHLSRPLETVNEF